MTDWETEAEGRQVPSKGAQPLRVLLCAQGNFMPLQPKTTKELGGLGIPGGLAVSLWGTLPLRQLGDPVGIEVSSRASMEAPGPSP